jgi:two-component system sensor kinase FixL
MRRVPMPLIAILVGLMAGLAVWLVLDQIQGPAVQRIFDKELKARLDLRSRESLIRFDRYMANYATMTRLLANHRRLAQYLEPLFWLPDESAEPIIYEGFSPFLAAGLLRQRIPRHARAQSRAAGGFARPGA